MKTCAVALAGVASATAFVAPSAFSGAQLKAAPSSSAMKMSFENELGAQAPLGFFDPLGVLDGQDAEFFSFLRGIEIKHGRIAMLAVTGHLVQQNVRFPGMLSHDVAFADLPNGYAGLLSVPPQGLMQIFAFIGFLELFVMKQNPESFPGDYRQGPKVNHDKAWEKLSEAKQLKKRAIELNNGRAAMMGIAGLMTHEVINGRPYVLNDILGISYSWN
ncbi:unnamed protein product [Chrysoparadoxa australica]